MLLVNDLGLLTKSAILYRESSYAPNRGLSIANLMRFRIINLTTTLAQLQHWPDMTRYKDAPFALVYYLLLSVERSIDRP